jgi:hypothetical protein
MPFSDVILRELDFTGVSHHRGKRHNLIGSHSFRDPVANIQPDGDAAAGQAVLSDFALTHDCLHWNQVERQQTARSRAAGRHSYERLCLGGCWRSTWGSRSARIQSVAAGLS